MRYVPTEVDIRWAKNIVRFIKDGGQLIYPNTELQYRVDHQKNNLTLLNPEILSQEDSKETHRRTIIVFSCIGWTVMTGDQTKEN